MERLQNRKHRKHHLELKIDLEVGKKQWLELIYEAWNCINLFRMRNQLRYSGLMCLLL